VRGLSGSWKVASQLPSTRPKGPSSTLHTVEERSRSSVVTVPAPWLDRQNPPALRNWRADSGFAFRARRSSQRWRPSGGLGGSSSVQYVTHPVREAATAAISLPGRTLLGCRTQPYGLADHAGP